tara:strand:+ start:1427 stop:1660 length:234 start_codon:yes stop_codon:yes gene_type:complete
LQSWHTVAIEKALAPPPLGSTATKTCDVFDSGVRGLYCIGGAKRLVMLATASVWKAFSEPSAEMPKDSRKLRTVHRP